MVTFTIFVVRDVNKSYQLLRPVSYFSAVSYCEFMFATHTYFPSSDLFYDFP